MKNIEKIGFDLGWDMRRYNQTILDGLNSSDVRDGWNAANLKYRKSFDKPDRWVLKWLQLRRSAYRRSIYFEPEVTPQYLLGIFQTECPITGLALTEATGLDTDFSVDRIQNNYGYVRGNIIFMSVYANTAKGALNIDEIEALVEANTSHNGLASPC